MVLEFLSILSSIYLAYILYFVLQDVCLLCTGIYAINIMLFAVALHQWSQHYKQHKVKRTKNDWVMTEWNDKIWEHVLLMKDEP